MVNVFMVAIVGSAVALAKLMAIFIKSNVGK